MSRIIDISQPIRPGIPVFPGDTEYQPFTVMKMDEGGSCNVGSITMSLHTGTHADAPRHFDNAGVTIENVDLDVYVGRALVIDCTGADRIEPENFDSIPDRNVERVLIKTGSAVSDHFNEDFAYLTAEAAEEAVRRCVRLIGIDTPSVDHATSKELSAHNVLLSGRVAILENLYLDQVKAGEYELIALPLRLVGLDASPVRAVLRTL